MIIGIDMDGVIAFTENCDYDNSKPNWDVINKVNEHFNKGDGIMVFTARGTRSGKDLKALTESQLRNWGVQYSELIMGKPVFDLYIDDIAINVKDWIG